MYFSRSYWKMCSWPLIYTYYSEWSQSYTSSYLLYEWYVYCANFTSCSITFLEPYICILCTNCISWKYDILYVKRHRAKSSTPLPSSTCLINCLNASNSHLTWPIVLLTYYLPINAALAKPCAHVLYLLNRLLCPKLYINVSWIR